uniref:Uncharacterized LOC103390504 n=1 Tax=Cynoglossus semilaevis TaxID=244447 RepID=A0A3P8UQD6_CYNSE
MDNKATLRTNQITQRLWPVFIMSTILASNIGPDPSNRIPHYYANLGHSVNLPCQINPALETEDRVVIKWLVKREQTEKHTEESLISYFGERICHHEACFQGRVHFAHSNPQDGDASLIMNNVTFSDSGIYQCNVEQSFSMEHRQILLTVMENVSKPICTLYNDFEEGKNLKVMCRVFHGPIPWSFNWEKTSGNRLFPTNTKQKYGYLIIQQIKKSDSGTYRCTVSNPVSAEHCEIIINPNSQSVEPTATFSPNILTSEQLGHTTHDSDNDTFMSLDEISSTLVTSVMAKEAGLNQENLTHLRKTSADFAAITVNTLIMAKEEKIRPRNHTATQMTSSSYMVDNRVSTTDMKKQDRTVSSITVAGISMGTPILTQEKGFGHLNLPETETATMAKEDRLGHTNLPTLGILSSTNVEEISVTTTVVAKGKGLGYTNIPGIEMTPSNVTDVKVSTTDTANKNRLDRFTLSELEVNSSIKVAGISLGTPVITKEKKFGHMNLPEIEMPSSSNVANVTTNTAKEDGIGHINQPEWGTIKSINVEATSVNTPLMTKEKDYVTMPKTQKTSSNVAVVKVSTKDTSKENRLGHLNLSEVEITSSIQVAGISVGTPVKTKEKGFGHMNTSVTETTTMEKEDRLGHTNLPKLGIVSSSKVESTSGSTLNTAKEKAFGYMNIPGIQMTPSNVAAVKVSTTDTAKENWLGHLNLAKMKVVSSTNVALISVDRAVMAKEKEFGHSNVPEGGVIGTKDMEIDGWLSQINVPKLVVTSSTNVTAVSADKQNTAKGKRFDHTNVPEIQMTSSPNVKVSTTDMAKQEEIAHIIPPELEMSSSTVYQLSTINVATISLNSPSLANEVVTGITNLSKSQITPSPNAVGVSTQIANNEKGLGHINLTKSQNTPSLNKTASAVKVKVKILW